MTQRLATFGQLVLSGRSLAASWVTLRWLLWGLGLVVTLGSPAMPRLGQPGPVLLLASTGAGIATSALVLVQQPPPRRLAPLLLALDVGAAAGLARASGGSESAFLAYTFAPVIAAGWLLGHRAGLLAGLLTAIIIAPGALVQGSYLAFCLALVLLGSLAHWHGRLGTVLAAQAVLGQRLDASETRARQLQEAARLAADGVVGHLDPSRVCLNAASVAQQFLGADRALVLLADPATGELRPAFDTAGGASLTWRRFAVPLSGPAAQLDDGPALRQLLINHGLPVNLAAPLRANGHLLGVLAIADAASRDRPPEDDETLRLLAGLTAAALAAARSHTERLAARQREELRQAELVEALASLQHALAEAADQRQICRRLAAALVSALRAERAGVFLIDRHGESASLAARHGTGWSEEVARPRPVPLAEDAPLAIRAIRSRRVAASSSDEPHLLLGATSRPASGIAAPVQVGEEILGAVFAEVDELSHAWREPERRFIRLLALLGGLSLRQARLRREVEQRAADLQTLTRATRSACSSRELRPTLDEILRLAVAQHDVFCAGLFLAGQPTLRVLVRHDGRPHDLTANPSDPLLSDALASSEPRWTHRPEEVPGALQGLGRLGSVLALPLNAAGQTHGVLLAGWAAGTLDASESTAESVQNFLRLLADQATLAISHARLRQRLHRLERGSAALLQVPRLAGSSLELGEALRAIAAMAAAGVQTERASVYLFDGQRWLTPLVAAGLNEEAEAAFTCVNLDVDSAPVLRDLIRHKCAVQTTGHRLGEAGLAEWPLLKYSRRLLGIPLLAGEAVVGALFIHEGRARREFSEEDVEWLLAVGRQAALAVSHAELRERVHQARSRERLLSLLASELARDDSLEHRLTTVLERLAEALPIRSGSIAVLERQELRVVARFGPPAARGERDGQRRPGGSTVRWDAESTPSGQRQEALAGATTWSRLAMPLMLNGTTLGVLEIDSEAPGALGEAELNFLSVLAGEVASAIERERARAEMAALVRWRERALQARDCQESASRLLASAIIRIGATDLLSEVDRGQAVRELRQAKELANESLHQMRLSVEALAPEASLAAPAVEGQAPLTEPGT